VIHQHIIEARIESDHLPIQHAEAVQLMRDFMLDPGQHMLHPKRYSNLIAMSTIWGVQTPTVDSSHMQWLYALMEIGELVKDR